MTDQPVDPYGIDIGITDAGDLSVLASGAIAFVSGPDNCVQALKLRMRTQVGELPLHPDYGSGLAQFVGKKSQDVQLIEAQANTELRKLIQADARFLAARDLQALQLTHDDGSIAPTAVQIRLNLQLSGGDTLAVGDLQTARVEEIVDPDTEDIAGLDELSDLGDLTFFSSGELEQDDLADAAAVDDLSTLPTEDGD